MVTVRFRVARAIDERLGEWPLNSSHHLPKTPTRLTAPSSPPCAHRSTTSYGASWPWPITTTTLPTPLWPPTSLPRSAPSWPPAANSTAPLPTSPTDLVPLSDLEGRRADVVEDADIATGTAGVADLTAVENHPE